MDAWLYGVWAFAISSCVVHVCPFLWHFEDDSYHPCQFWVSTHIRRVTEGDTITYRRETPVPLYDISFIVLFSPSERPSVIYLPENMWPALLREYIARGWISETDFGFNLTSVTEADAGVYRVKVMTESGIRCEDVFTLYVQKVPSDPVLDISEPTIANQAYNATCQAYGTSVPAEHRLPIVYTWSVSDGGGVGVKHTVTGEHNDTLSVFTHDVTDYQGIDVTCVAKEQDSPLSSNTTRALLTKSPTNWTMVLLVSAVSSAAFVAIVVGNVVFWFRRNRRRRKRKSKSRILWTDSSRQNSIYEPPPVVGKLKVKKSKFNARRPSRQAPPLPTLPVELHVINPEIPDRVIRKSRDHTYLQLIDDGVFERNTKTEISQSGPLSEVSQQHGDKDYIAAGGDGSTGVYPMTCDDGSSGVHLTNCTGGPMTLPRTFNVDGSSLAPRPTSGDGLTGMSLTNSGDGLTGVPLTSSGDDLTGVPLTISGDGLNGVPLTTSGDGLTGVSLTTSGDGLTGVTHTNGGDGFTGMPLTPSCDSLVRVTLTSSSDGSTGEPLTTSGEDWAGDPK